MNDWISALARLQDAAEPCVLVTIIEELGSTPRNAGSKMVVDRTASHDTIGGGHLEFKAIEIARQMLDAHTEQPRLERFSLGASLGQCCGGATVVLFEPLVQVQAQLAVFGAGHVARALIPVLANLPLKVHWIDNRAQEFPAQIPLGVRKVLCEEPLDEIGELPKGCYCLVMTHNHALDLELAEAILRRDDLGWFGLIGSKSKAARFQHRLRDRGFSPEQIQRMQCPVGLPDVKGKLPGEIAVSIAGQIIATYNARFGLQDSRNETVTRLLPASRRDQAQA